MIRIKKKLHIDLRQTESTYRCKKHNWKKYSRRLVSNGWDLSLFRIPWLSVMWYDIGLDIIGIIDFMVKTCPIAPWISIKNVKNAWDKCAMWFGVCSVGFSSDFWVCRARTQNNTNVYGNTQEIGVSEARTQCTYQSVHDEWDAIHLFVEVNWTEPNWTARALNAKGLHNKMRIWRFFENTWTNIQKITQKEAATAVDTKGQMRNSSLDCSGIPLWSSQRITGKRKEITKERMPSTGIDVVDDKRYTTDKRSTALRKLIRVALRRERFVCSSQMLCNVLVLRRWLYWLSF